MLATGAAREEGAMETATVSPAAPPHAGGAGALVMGADYRGLGIVRSLGRRGIPVWVLRGEHGVAATSRYARYTAAWTGDDDQVRLAQLMRLGEEHSLDGWALYPTTDEDAELVARHHGILSRRFKLTTPPWDVLRWASDKRLMYSLAAQTGVARPWTVYPRSREAVKTLECEFPILLKPAGHARAANPLATDKAWPVRDREELLTRYDEARAWLDADAVMLQEMIPGGGDTQASFVALCAEGRVLASATARRIRQYPIDFGRASTFVEIADVPAIEEPSQRLLAALLYTGMVEVEFKLDRRSGAYKVLDVNPRAWGWHALCRRAGLDFPYLEWRRLHGEPIGELRARTGARWLRLSQDLPAAASAIRRGSLSPLEYARSLRGPLDFAILAPDDPLPALADLPMLAYLAWKRRRA